MQTPLNRKAQVTTQKIEKEFTYESVLMLTLDIAYPQIRLKNDASVQNQINRHYRREARRFLSYAKNELLQGAIAEYKDSRQNGFPFRPYDAVMEYTVSLNDDCILSTYADHYEYTGGAHGSTTRFSDSWELRTGYRIRMRDLFTRRENYRRAVLEQILMQADEQMQENPGIFFEDYRTLIIKYFDPESFYLTPSGIAVYYQQYEIGPYASGIIVFDIPYASLGIKKPGCSE
ncbi:MAG: DUF3298 and DUF4163 domain-containing protein [Bacillota bacterium]